tara:strand:- start:158 stop:382 length:225 start_codon:yes stop_codon:yes gene_type:complete
VNASKGKKDEEEEEEDDEEEEDEEPAVRKWIESHSRWANKLDGLCHAVRTSTNNCTGSLRTAQLYAAEAGKSSL